MGRPRQNEVREVQRNFRFTVSEDAVVRRRAELAGKTIMDFGRAAMLAGTFSGQRSHLTVPSRSTEEIRMYEEIRRVGVNLNQLVRWLNTHPDQPMPADLPPLLTEIRTHLQAVLTDGA